MVFFIRNEHGRKAWASQVAKICFDAKTTKLPAHEIAPRVVQGIRVWLLPKHRTDGIWTAKHRAMCECPACGKIVPIGRLDQHGKVHKEA